MKIPFIETDHSKTATSEDTQDTTTDEEPEEDTVKPAYDLTRDNTIKFTETITINSDTDSDFATVTIETISDTISFEVRVTGYTSRFNELDVEYITGGGYAINLYHPKEDGYFVRRLYYYGDEDGIGNEQQQERSVEPSNIVWDRKEDMGEPVTKEFTSTYITVYDWRENMLTSGKPTPNDGEVVVRFEDSLRAGGGRKKVDNVFNVTNVQGLIDDIDTVEFISIDVQNGSYVLHSTRDSAEPCLVSVPLNETASLGNCKMEPVKSLDSPFNVSNVIWTRDPEKTWSIKGFDSSKSEV